MTEIIDGIGKPVGAMRVMTSERPLHRMSDLLVLEGPGIYDATRQASDAGAVKSGAEVSKEGYWCKAHIAEPSRLFADLLQNPRHLYFLGQISNYRGYPEALDNTLPTKIFGFRLDRCRATKNLRSLMQSVIRYENITLPAMWHFDDYEVLPVHQMPVRHRR